MAIKHWPASERPRERLLAQGPAALSDAELLALLLGSGSAGASALDHARGALQRLGSVGALLTALSMLVPAQLARSSRRRAMDPPSFFSLSLRSASATRSPSVTGVVLAHRRVSLRSAISSPTDGDGGVTSRIVTGELHPPATRRSAGPRRS
jgi:hypothetical protein